MTWNDTNLTPGDGADSSADADVESVLDAAERLEEAAQRIEEAAERIEQSVGDSEDRPDPEPVGGGS